MKKIIIVLLIVAGVLSANKFMKDNFGNEMGEGTPVAQEDVEEDLGRAEKLTMKVINGSSDEMDIQEIDNTAAKAQETINKIPVLKKLSQAVDNYFNNFKSECFTDLTSVNQGLKASSIYN